MDIDDVLKKALRDSSTKVEHPEIARLRAENEALRHDIARHVQKQERALRDILTLARMASDRRAEISTRDLAEICNRALAAKEEG